MDLASALQFSLRLPKFQSDEDGFGNEFNAVGLFDSVAHLRRQFDELGGARASPVRQGEDVFGGQRRRALAWIAALETRVVD